MEMILVVRTLPGRTERSSKMTVNLVPANGAIRTKAATVKDEHTAGAKPTFFCCLWAGLKSCPDAPKFSNVELRTRQIVSR